MFSSFFPIPSLLFTFELYWTSAFSPNNFCPVTLSTTKCLRKWCQVRGSPSTIMIVPLIYGVAQCVWWRDKLWWKDVKWNIKMNAIINERQFFICFGNVNLSSIPEYFVLVNRDRDWVRWVPLEFLLRLYVVGNLNQSQKVGSRQWSSNEEQDRFGFWIIHFLNCRFQFEDLNVGRVCKTFAFEETRRDETRWRKECETEFCV